MSKYHDLTWQKFNMLTVIKKSFTKNKKIHWECVCDCGNNSIVRSDQLKSGRIKSCGCLQHRPNHEDLVGNKFGKLTVLSLFEVRGVHKRVLWNCICDCGKLCVKATTDMKSGRSLSCGCLALDIKKNRLINLVGQKFNRLTVIKLADEINGRRKYWICQCECGKICTVATPKFKCFKYLSCGCLKIEMKRDAKLLSILKGMKTRCEDVNSDGYVHYGKKGVSIFEDWKLPKNFIKWSLDNGYKIGLTIDRKDNNGNYCPSNCQWISFRANLQKTTKTTPLDIVRKIKMDIANDIPVKELKIKYNIPVWTIRNIKKGATFSDVF